MTLALFEALLLFFNMCTSSCRRMHKFLLQQYLKCLISYLTEKPSLGTTEEMHTEHIGEFFHLYYTISIST